MKNALFYLFILLLPGLAIAANDSAVILQYHNISATTPASTSVTPQQFKQHLDWLNNNHFKVMPLKDIIHHLRNNTPLPGNRIAAITIDDAHISVCDNAWPILKQRNMPFTLFVSTLPITEGYSSNCSWQQLQRMQQSGLMTIANHSYSHPHLLHNHASLIWKQTVTNEITESAQHLKQHLGGDNQLFAYPYGEYNQQLQQLTQGMGYISFGQQSGAIGPHSDFSALPRFAASGTYANLKTLSVKLQSRAFPATLIPSSNNPIAYESANNPPQLTLTLHQTLPNPVNCYDGNGNTLIISYHDKQIQTQAGSPLSKGRHRYNCTSYTGEGERYYWISYQWLIQQSKKRRKG